MTEQREIRAYSPEPPEGWAQLRWYGPGLLWMVSSVGSGAVLFTPRVGSRYEYAFLWAALVVIFLMWVMIREVGRYTVVTGKTILDGYRDLPGPSNWAIWFIFLPQIVAAVVTIAGIAALFGSALMIAAPGSQAVYASALMVLAAALVVTGKYRSVERVAAVMAGLLIAVVLLSAFRVLPSPGTLGAGLVPTLPADFDFYFLLPWLGFILAGAAGIMWYSYWVAAREYGGPVGEAPVSPDEGDNRERRAARINDWIRVMSMTAVVGVVGGGLVIISFLILGAELLAPEGIVPEGVAVADDLARLLSEVWGPAGFWFLILGVALALSGTILANQDGWGRMLADATLILWPRLDDRQGVDRGRLKNAYVIAVLTVVPLVVFFLIREPVQILSIGGIVAATHTPVVVFLTILLNRKTLPKRLQPGVFWSATMIAAGAFFATFAALYFLDLLGLTGSLGRWVG